MKERGWWRYALIALVLVDLVLVLSAVGVGPLARKAAKPSTPATTGSGPSPSSSRSEGASPSTSSKRSGYLVSAFDATNGWRAQKGACADAASVEATDDGGKTWAPMPSPGGQVLRVKLTDQSAGLVVTTDQDCRPVLRSTNTDAQWGAPKKIKEVWSLDADKSKKVIGPKAVQAPCGSAAPRALAPVSDLVGLVLCATGGIERSDDGGKTWVSLGSLPGATTLSASRTAVLLGVPGSGACKGVGMVLGTLTATTLGLGSPTCVKTSNPKTAGVALTGVDGWLVTSDGTWHSADLATWSKAS